MYSEHDLSYLCFEEINAYLDDQGSDLKLDQKQKRMLFDSIDKDGSNSIDRQELSEFIELLIEVNTQMMNGKLKNPASPKANGGAAWGNMANKVISWSDAINMIVQMQQRKAKAAEEARLAEEAWKAQDNLSPNAIRPNRKASNNSMSPRGLTTNDLLKGSLSPRNISPSNAAQMKNK